MSQGQSINCNAGHRYLAQVQIPGTGADSDKMVTPALGTITDVKVRFCATEKGPALNAALDNLPAAETDLAALFAVSISQGLHQAYMLPLRVGKKFFGVWSKPGQADFLVQTFMVSDRSHI